MSSSTNSPNGRKITVHKNFAALLDDGYNKTNFLLKAKLKKKMTKIDYTEFLANIMDKDFGVFLTRGMVMPMKKGKKSKRVMLYSPGF